MSTKTSIVDSDNDEIFIANELSNILKEFQHGIKPNSLQILSTSKTNNATTHETYGAVFKLTLLEDIELKIGVSKAGFTIIQATREENNGKLANDDLERILPIVNQPFETMDALLFKASPRFGKSFHDTLLSKLGNEL
ncbi:8946_t:CDS:2 [Ambispora gerdemannii]|uniref:8946_t:CDS:1 n=1 Tax=Ambispora gerdemannii TaxID=144530 RepID=A0A9N8Z8M2_9GLOM|nr:8946_t:CDS:2 [Ambispora gerdemannii]